MGKRNQEAAELIETLEKNSFYAECPCGCGNTFLLREADLFYLENFTDQAREIYDQRLLDAKEGKLKLKERQANIAERLEKKHRPIQAGHISEKIAPCLAGFCYNHADCRSLLDPIDYLVFEGISTKGVVSRIIFTEIKTGKNPLNDHQKEIKALVAAKKVAFDTYGRGSGK